MTDWKDNRHWRLLAWDHGLLTWVDTAYSGHNTWPVTLVTWPPRADTRAGDREPLYQVRESSHVRLLVWSDVRIMRVSVTIDDGHPEECQHGQGPLWTCPWSPELYISGTHSLMVRVEDEFGYKHETRHEFSLESSSLNTVPWTLGTFVILFNMVSFCQVKL